MQPCLKCARCHTHNLPAVNVRGPLVSGPADDCIFSSVVLTTAGVFELDCPRKLQTDYNLCKNASARVLKGAKKREHISLILAWLH